MWIDPESSTARTAETQPSSPGTVSGLDQTAGAAVEAGLDDGAAADVLGGGDPGSVDGAAEPTDGATDADPPACGAPDATGGVEEQATRANDRRLPPAKARNGCRDERLDIDVVTSWSAGLARSATDPVFRSRRDRCRAPSVSRGSGSGPVVLPTAPARQSSVRPRRTRDGRT